MGENWAKSINYIKKIGFMGKNLIFDHFCGYCYCKICWEKEKKYNKLNKSNIS
jgi:hypothetical protein